MTDGNASSVPASDFNGHGGVLFEFTLDILSNGTRSAIAIPTGSYAQVGSDIVFSGFNRAVDQFGFSPDSSDIFYLADSRSDGTFELFRVSTPIPEPTSLLLMVGVAACRIVRRR